MRAARAFFRAGMLGAVKGGVREGWWRMDGRGMGLLRDGWGRRMGGGRIGWRKAERVCIYDTGRTISMFLSGM